MKYILRLFFITAFINIKAVLFSQSLQSTLKSAIDKYCDSLKSSGIDTSIILFYSNDDIFFLDTLKGVGKTGIVESAFVMYFKNTKWQAIKLFYGIPIDKNNGSIFNSQSIIFSESDTLKQIRFLIPKIKTEQFAPYIFAYKENNETVYLPFGSSRHSRCEMIVRWKDYYVSKEISENEILEKPKFPDDMPINLNFKYNKSLSLYTFYQLFNSINLKVDSQFIFKKSNF